jgi:hypothetical protein
VPVKELRRQTRAAATAPPSPPLSSPSPGRGGPQHIYLQELIKRWADANDWKATIEKPVLDGLGSVDITLEKGSRSVACEIAVGSTPALELKNLQKCLSAGFADVVSVVVDQKMVKAIESAVKSLEDAKRVRVLMPENLFAWLETLVAKDAPVASKSVRGYKVRIRRPEAGRDSATVEGQTVARTIAKALRRMKSTST